MLQNMYRNVHDVNDICDIKYEICHDTLVFKFVNYEFKFYFV